MDILCNLNNSGDPIIALRSYPWYIQFSFQKFLEFSIPYDNTQEKIQGWVRKTMNVTEPLIKGKWRIF
jgi:hypothetical protein